MVAVKRDVEVAGENMEEDRMTTVDSNKVAMVEVDRKRVAMEEADSKAIREATVEEVIFHRAGTTVEVEATEVEMMMICLALLITPNSMQEIQAILESSRAS